jgi:hypothetical protein
MKEMVKTGKQMRYYNYIDPSIAMEITALAGLPHLNLNIILNVYDYGSTLRSFNS